MVTPVFTISTFVATNATETFSGGSTDEEFLFDDGDGSLFAVVDPNTNALLAGTDPHDIFGNFFSFLSAVVVKVFSDVTVDYSFSPSPVRIDLSLSTQHGGFAEGDRLSNVFSIFGSSLNDIIRGSDENTGISIFNDPGINSLFGGGGDDIIEGRSGADLINGGAVTIRLATSRRPPPLLWPSTNRRKMVPLAHQAAMRRAIICSRSKT